MLALIDTNTKEIIEVRTSTEGWMDIPGVGKVSPVQIGWSYENYSILEVNTQEVPHDKIVVSESFVYNESTNKIDQELVLEDKPIFKRLVPKSTIISRLTDEQLETAISLMTIRQQERWRAPDQKYILFDDPETIEILTHIGADPSYVLAEEDE